MSHDDGAKSPKSWREVAEQASHESDPRKLMEMIRELCDLLEADQRIPLPKAKLPAQKPDMLS
jgi:hypothetical protein